MSTTSAAPSVPSGSAQATAVASLRLLGGFEASRGGRPVELPHSAQRLLAFLAVSAPHVQRSFVAGTLWTDAPEARAHASLRSTLWRLRRSGFAFVEARGSVLSLRPELAVDYGRAIEVARRNLDSREPCAAELMRMLPWDLLPDWYDDWLEAPRERLRQLRLHGLERAAELLAARGSFGDAVDVALATIRIDPLRESAHRALIAVYLAEGNRSEALRAYAACRARLASAGLMPSSRIEELVREL